MREHITRWAGRIGHRDSLAHIRDQFVDLLNGDKGDRNLKRNRLDDRNLKLLLSFCLHSHSNCLEVGAHLGKFLHEIQRVAPAGHHIVYEPQRNQWERLIRLFPEMDIRQRALSDHDGEARFLRVLDRGFRGYSRLDGLGEQAEWPSGLHTESTTVSIERLDNHVPDGWLPQFVKIDVEGAELHVLRGAIQTLRRSKPIVAFEHGWNRGNEEMSAEVFGLLHEEIGLRLFDMDGHGPLDWDGFGEAAQTRWNWVAHP
jgi:FkbM family methyltransferase